MSARVTQADGKTVDVQNLGWLMRHWRDVAGFEVMPPSQRWHVLAVPGGERRDVLGDVNAQSGYPDCLLLARLKDGGLYATHYASIDVLRRWLDRPVFRSLPVAWFGVKLTIGKEIKANG